MKKLVILGAGTGGTIMANLLHRRLHGRDWSVTVIDRNDNHYYQPGFLFIPFGFTTKEDILKKKSKFLPRGVEFVVAEVERVDPASNAVLLADGRRVPYDLLVLATGADIAPSETPGPRPWPRSSGPSPAGGSSSTSTRCPSSAPSPRSSSSSSATGASAATAGATRSSSST